MTVLPPADSGTGVSPATIWLLPRVEQGDPAWYTGAMAEQKTTLESLARLISRAAASADKKFVALAEDIAEIREDMVTKDDLAATESRLDRHIDTLDATVIRTRKNTRLPSS